MTRLLTTSQALRNYHVGHALPFHQSGGATSLKLETLTKFAAANALLMPMLADDLPEDSENFSWVPMPAAGDTPFIPRGYVICFILNQTGYDAAVASAPLAELTPWQPGDGAAYALIVDVLSLVRNGSARLIVAFSEWAEQHPAFARLREVMWYTRTAKGLAMTEYFKGHGTGRMITRTFANGKTQEMPLFTLAVADWHAHVDRVVEKLVGLEDNFSDTLAELHQNMRQVALQQQKTT